MELYQPQRALRVFVTSAGRETRPDRRQCECSGNHNVMMGILSAFPHVREASAVTPADQMSRMS